MASMVVQRANSSSSVRFRWAYDVFLSFRGKDTRDNFVSHLYAALALKGIHTFKDDEKLERGKEISPELRKAIRESRFSIVVLSKNYASSRWCLDELVEILECSNTTVYPIFYHVKPSEVRSQTEPTQTGRFRDEFEKLVSKQGDLGIEKVQKWRNALEQVAKFSGWPYPSDSIVRELEMIELLGLGRDDARVVGIWGMGGIGCSFIENVREVSEKGGWKTLQEQLISEILMEKDVRVGNVGSALSTIRNRVKHQQMGGYGKLVCRAVKLKESLLNEVQQVLKVNNKLMMHDLIQELGWNIVRQESPKEPGQRSRLWLHEDSTHVLMENTGTKKVEGIVMEYLDLRSRDPKDIGLKELKLRPKAFAKMSNLRILKICCMYISENLKYLSNKLRYLDWCEYPMKYMPSTFQPERLVELHLKYSNIEQLWEGTMHLDTLRIMNLSHSTYLTKCPDFMRIPNLERLILEGCTGLVNLDPFIEILKSLIFLNLKDCKNLMSLPSGIQLESLEVLNVSGCSKLKNILVNFGYMKRLLELYLDGIGVSELPPSIGHLTNLVLLSLSNCKNLRSIPDNICQLKALTSLNLSRCFKLDKLPQDVGILDCLKELRADWTAIRQLPPSIGLLKKLKTLSLEGWLESLERLDLNDYLSGNYIESLPTTMNKLSNLVCLYLNGCKRLQELPELSSDIRNIEANDCTSLRTILSLPKYDNVEGFSFMNCFKLVENEQNNILSEKFLSNQFQIPRWFSHQSRGCSVSFELPPHWYNDRFLGIVFAVVGIKNKSKCCKFYSIEVGFKRLGIQMIVGKSPKNELAYFQYVNSRNLEVIYVPLTDFPSSMEDDDMEQLNEGGIEFQACLVRRSHSFDCLTKAVDEDFSFIEGDVKLGVHLVYEKEDDEEAWSIDSSESEDNMGVFHGDLERLVGGAGVEVASSSATTSKRRYGDLNDNHDYDAAAGPSGGFDCYDDEEDHPHSKRLRQAGPSGSGNFD
ncbi:unnamed protein product [Camellia sinensis]